MSLCGKVCRRLEWCIGLSAWTPGALHQVSGRPTAAVKSILYGAFCVLWLAEQRKVVVNSGCADKKRFGQFHVTRVCLLAFLLDFKDSRQCSKVVIVDCSGFLVDGSADQKDKPFGAGLDDSSST